MYVSIYVYMNVYINVCTYGFINVIVFFVRFMCLVCICCFSIYCICVAFFLRCFDCGDVCALRCRFISMIIDVTIFIVVC